MNNRRTIKAGRTGRGRIYVAPRYRRIIKERRGASDDLVGSLGDIRPSLGTVTPSPADLLFTELINSRIPLGRYYSRLYPSAIFPSEMKSGYGRSKRAFRVTRRFITP